MQELLRKRTADLTVIEMLELSYLTSATRFPTLSLDEFCRASGKSRKHIVRLMANRLLREELIVGGYEGRKQKCPVRFRTDKVIEYLKNNSI